MAGIWSDLLEISPIGISDNFFDIGGHSLMATRVMSRIRETFSVEIPLSDLFEFPTIEELAQRLTQARQEEPPAAMERIDRDDKDIKLPLSFAQQRLWFLSQLETEEAAYNMPSALSLEGELDEDALVRSIHEIVQRHETLRMCFPTIDGQPSVTILESDFHFDTVSLENLEDDKQQEEFRRLTNEEFWHTFDLSTGPLFRASLLRLKPDSHILLANMHHIISDGWSIAVLVGELTQLYHAFSNGQPSPLPDLEVQYVDFAHWQRQWLTGDVLEKQSRYWKQQLSGAPALLELPTDNPRPPIQTFDGDVLHLFLEEDTTQALTAVSRETGSTLFMTLLSAFGVLMSRYSGQTDIVMGSPIANRTSRQVEPLIGFFVNTLVFRLDLEDNPGFRELLGQTRKTALDAYAHQDLPFEQLVEELHPVRSLSYSPLFQVMFALQNAPVETLELPGLKLAPVPKENVIANFDLSLFMEEAGGGLAASFEYNSQLFERETIQRMSDHFQTLLKGIAANSEQPVAELPLLTEAEKQQILAEWNDTASDYPKDKCIHDIFEEQALRAPNAIAVVAENDEINYATLNRKAAHLAAYLQNRAIKPETLVGVSFRRSIPMFIALLGILKAGAAYLPVDPDYPRERIDYLLKESNVEIVLNPETLADVPMDSPETPTLSDSVLPVSSNLAYVIYTSGSTGMPKGVAVEHRSVVRLTVNNRFINLGPDDRCMQSGSLAFDNSTFEIWGVLLNGGSVCSLPHELSILDSEALDNFIRHNNINTLSLIASIFNQNVTGHIELFQPLNHIVVGGEKVSAPHINILRETYPALNIIHAYGPTENTTFTTTLTVEKTYPGDMPIGKPISNTQVYILGHAGEPVPVGVTGELCAAGDGVARGYLNQPELTASRFVGLKPQISQITQIFKKGHETGGNLSQSPDLGSGLSTSSAVIYKTGDLARWLPDGNIEYLGRGDNQVKVRGFRVELGEIETILAKHETVSDCAVAIHEDAPGDRKLKAYFVPVSSQEESDGNENQLRDYLGEHLPEFMVPSYFIPLEELPLSPNGKVDRKALDQLSLEGVKLSDKPFVAPRTPGEELLAGIWSELLKLETVGIHDNFFELGGHSLLATRVMSRIRETFSIDLSVRHLFESPTVAGLAVHIANAGHSENLPGIEPIDRDTHAGNLPLSFAQQGLWFLSKVEGGLGTYNIPSAFHLKGQLNRDVLEKSLQAVVMRHESLRTSFPSVDGAPVARVSDTPFELEIRDLLGLTPEEQEFAIQRMIDNEAFHSFDLETGPLFRCALVRMGDNHHVLVLNMHHIVSDGWSIGVFIHEWSLLYDAFSHGKESPLSPLPIQYVDFAHWQRQWLSGDLQASQLDYWKKQLGGTLPSLSSRLIDYAEDDGLSVEEYQGAQQTLLLPADLTARLKTLGQKENSSLFMTLLAAFNVMLYRYTGIDDTIVGTPLVNRNHLNTEGIIGLFINILALRTDLSGEPRFTDVLARVRNVTLDAYTHQDIPFEQLVGELQTQRGPNRHPVYEVMLNFINIPNPESLEIPGLEVLPIDTPEFDSKRLMTLYVEERGENLHLLLAVQRASLSLEWMNAFLNQFKFLLEQITETPERQIQNYSLATEESKSLVPDPSEALSQPEMETVLSSFLSWAEQTPEQTAVSLLPGSWTYRDLSESARSIARALIAGGLKSGDVVAVTGKREFGLIASVLGVMFSGGVLLTLDGNLPTRRQKLMVEETEARFLLVLGETDMDTDDIGEDLIVLHIDSNAGLPKEPAPADTTLPEIKPEDAAYIFFTSGSTGKPKGILGQHRGLAHFIKWQRETFNVGPKDRCTQLTGLSFDALLRDIFLPLTSGGTLCLPVERDDFTPAVTLGWLQEEGITILHAVPSLTQSWLIGVSSEITLSALRCLFLVGEPLTEKLVRQWREAFPGDRQVINLYGTTETTLAMCYYLVPDNPLPGVQPLGRGISHSQALVLGPENQLCGIDEPGEIVLRTPFRTLGYIGDAVDDSSLKGFVQNPYSDDETDLLYFTGDRGCYRSDGSLRFVGRVDDQVKIRGVRVEPGEIETLLAVYPGVREVAVVVPLENSETKRLVAYITPDEDDEEDVSAQVLRAYLENVLPEYMVPSLFVILDELPLTPNGKIDRRALSGLTLDAAQISEQPFVGPRDFLELRLIRIWEELLNVRPIGLHDDFFQVGGYSLLAIRLIAEIKEQLGIDLPLAMLYDKTTVEQLAVVLRSAPEPVEWSPVVPIQSKGTKPPLFCVHPAGGSVMGYFELARQLGEGQPVYGLQIYGLEEGQKPYETIEEMATAYIEGIRTIQPEGPYQLLGWSFGGRVAFDMARQLQEQNQEIRLLAMMDSAEPTRKSKQNLDEKDDAQVFLDIINIFREEGISVSHDHIKELPPDEQMAYVVQQGREANVFPPDVNEGHIRRFMELFKTNILAAMRFQAKIFKGKIIFFEATDRAGKPEEHRGKGWEPFTTEGVEVFPISSTHQEIVKSPHVEVVVEQLKKYLEAVENGS